MKYNRVRTERRQFRFTKEELAELNERFAASTTKNMSDFILELLRKTK